MKNSALLPERHIQQDFFIADIFDSLPVKNDYHTMEHPFFALSTKPDIREVYYNRNGIEITLSPHHRLGLPTMFDKDILLYCGSLIMAQIKKNPNGSPPPRTLRFSCHDLMVTTNRHTNDVAYKQLKNAFERLKGVSITTNIKTNDIKESSGFGLIDSWHIIEKSHTNSRMIRIEVTLSKWFYNALIGKEVLTINRDYFRLRKGLERRLYELARKHCGYQSEWKIKLANLREKSGSLSPLFKFRFQVREIIQNDAQENHFPDYGIELDDKDNIIFYRKNSIRRQSKNNLKLPNFPDYIREEEVFSRLSHKTLFDICELINKKKEAIPFESLFFQFTTYIAKAGEPENINGAFIGFVKHKLEHAS